MREIKFRAKSGTQWRYGDLYHNERGELVIYEPKTSGKTLDGEAVLGWRLVVDPETVGQYTGLKDYDGNEIYEGDILRDTEGRIFQVIWNTGAGAWEFVGSKLHMLFIMTYPDLYKVVGNVHDNPNLMEASHD